MAAGVFPPSIGCSPDEYKKDRKIPNVEGVFYIELWKDGEIIHVKKVHGDHEVFAVLQDYISDGKKFCVYKAQCVLDAS
jgi:hypothetical protein